MNRYLSACLLGACLLVPMAVKADDNNHHQDKRYYDRDAKDWHEWSQKEDQAYHRYLREQRLTDREWATANRKEQREYYRWRHNHPDAVVVPDRH